MDHSRCSVSSTEERDFLAHGPLSATICFSISLSFPNVDFRYNPVSQKEKPSLFSPLPNYIPPH